MKQRLVQLALVVLMTAGVRGEWEWVGRVATEVTRQAGIGVGMVGDGGMGVVCGWVREREKGQGQELWVRRGAGGGWEDAVCVEDCERGAWLAVGVVGSEEWVAARGPWGNPVVYRERKAPMRVVVSTQVLHEVDARLFGEFLEHPTWGGEGGIESGLIPGTHELQPGVVELLRQMNIPLLRFPAGTDIDFMDWTDMIDNVPYRTNAAGEVLPRPVTWGFNPPGDVTYASNYFGYDELYRLCTNLGCQAVLTVNFRDALLKLKPLDEAAKHAAGLVAYCNAPTNAVLPAGMPDWPSVRAMNGSVAPYGVRYFQLGNETWFFADDPWWYAQCVTAYVARMRQVDPSIEILVDAVTPTQVAAVAALAGSTVQYLVQHEYLPFSIANTTLERWGQPWTASKLDVEDVWYAWVASPNQMTGAGESGVDNLALRLAPEYGYKAAMTEWNWVGGWTSAWGAPLDSFWARGLGAAGFLHAMMRVGDRLALACQSLAVGHRWSITAIRVSPTAAFAPFFLPCGQAVMMYSKYHGNRRVNVEIENLPQYAQPFRMNLLSAKAVVAVVDVIATASDEALYVHCINRHFRKDIVAEVDVRAWQDVHGTGIVHVLWSDVLHWYYPEGPAIAELRDEGVIVSSGVARVVLPKRSIAIVEIRRGGAAAVTPVVWQSSTGSVWQTEVVLTTNEAWRTLSAASVGERLALVGCRADGLSVWETKQAQSVRPAFTNVFIANPPSMHAVTAQIHMEAGGRIWLAVCLTNELELGAWTVVGREKTMGNLVFEWWLLGGGGPAARQLGITTDGNGAVYVTGISADRQWVVYDNATGNWRTSTLGLANTGTPCAVVGIDSNGVAWVACATRYGTTNALEIWHNAYNVWERDAVLTSSVSAVAHGYGGVASWAGFVMQGDKVVLGVAPAQTRTFEVYQRPLIPESNMLGGLLVLCALWLWKCRMRIIVGAVVFACMLGAANAADGVREYENPLDVMIADPYVLFENGVYYLYGTTRMDGFEVYTSRDLVNWHYGGYVYRATRVSWPETYLWAPEVVRKGTNYYLFYCARGKARDGQRLTARLCVARAASPRGPFVDVRAPAFDLGYAMIDPHVWFDDRSNAFLFYTRDCSEAPQSEIWVGALTDDLLAFQEPPRRCFGPSQPWEGTVWNEAPFVLARGGRVCLMYSGNYFGDMWYGVGYAIATNVYGPWEKAAHNPILRARENVWGPGHHCVVPSPDGKELFMVYHRQVRPNYGLRMLAIDRLEIEETGGAISLGVKGPTSTPQPYPSGAPAFAYGATDHFTSRRLDRRRWLVFNERPQLWALRDGALRITATDGDVHRERFDAANIFLQYLPPGDCVIETQVAVEPRANYEQAFICVWQDADNFIRLAYVFADGLKFEAAQEVRGEYRSIVRPTASAARVTLRIERRGTRYACRARADAGVWIEVGSFEGGWPVVSCGVGAIAPVSGRAFISTFDYFAIQQLE